MVSLIVLQSDLVSHQVITLVPDLNWLITCCSVVFPVPLKLVHGLFQRSTQYTPTVVLSEKASPHLKAENSFTSYTEGTVSVYGEGAYKSNVWVRPAFLTIFRTRNSYKYQCTLASSLHFVLKVFWECERLLPRAAVPESVDELQHCGGGWSAEQLGAGETWNVRGWGCALWDGLHHWWRFGHWIRHIWVGEVSFNHEYFL